VVVVRVVEEEVEAEVLVVLDKGLGEAHDVYDDDDDDEEEEEDLMMVSLARAAYLVPAPHALIWRLWLCRSWRRVWLGWFEPGCTGLHLGIGNDHDYQATRAWRDLVKKRFMVSLNAILFSFAERVLARVQQYDGAVIVFGLRIYDLKTSRGKAS